MNYRAYFKSIEDKMYRVEVITDPASIVYEDMVLSGDSPVSINYTSGESLFDPVRTSTATVRMLSSDYPMDIYTGHAMGTRVDILEDTSDKVVWTGYLQPNLYSQGYSAPTEEIELECSDIISTLQYFDYEPLDPKGKKRVVMFDSIIRKMLERFPMMHRYFVSSSTKYESAPGVMSEFTLLDAMISEQNFFSTEDEPWSLKEVLEEICRYFGLTAFVEGDELYLVDFSTYTDTSAIEGYVTEKYPAGYSWKAPVKETLGNEYTLSSDSYRMTGGQMSIDDVYNKVQVRDNFYELKEMIPPLLDDEMLVPYTGDMKTSMYKLLKGKNKFNYMALHKDYVTYFFWKNKKWKTDHYDYIWPTRQPVDDPEVEVPDERVLNTDVMTQYRGGNFISMDYTNVNKEGNNAPIKLTKYLHISHLNGGAGSVTGEALMQNNHPMVETTEVPPICFGAHQYLVLDMKCLFTFYQNRAYIDPNLAKEIKKVSGGYTYEGKKFNPAQNGWVIQIFYLRLNGKWYNGGGWQNERTGFPVYLQPLAYASYFQTETSVGDKIHPSMWMSTNGAKISLPENGGYVDDFYFAIGQSNWLCLTTGSYEDFHDPAGYTWGTAHQFISDFQILNDYQESYFDNNGKKGIEKDKDAKPDNVFENVIDTENVQEFPMIDLRITSDNGKGFSYSNVMFTNVKRVVGSSAAYEPVMENSTPNPNNPETKAFPPDWERPEKPDGGGTIDPTPSPNPNPNPGEPVEVTGPVMLDVLKHPKFDQAQKPEENIIERYVRQYSTPTIRENITIDRTPNLLSVVRDPFWNKKFFIMGGEIDLQMERQTLDLIERKF